MSKEHDVFMNRTRFDITASILELATTPQKKTHLMYKANLSYRQLRVYVDFLKSIGLLQNRSNGMYRTTEKGLDFLRGYQQITVLLNTRK